MKATAIAPANIAFIKYWGKTNDELRLPANASISMNLSGAYTKTTVEFSSTYLKDAISLIGGIFSTNEKARVEGTLDRIRKKTGIHLHAKVVTLNSFPKGTGAAASASGFAALAMAASKAAALKLSEKELTILARLGSGSACRSIPDGFVLWVKGDTSSQSYAYSLYPPDYWDVRDILAIVDTRMKKISTTQGQASVATSPHWKSRVKEIPRKIERLKKILKEKNFEEFGRLIEDDCLDMHNVMQTQVPPIFYWNKVTKKIMEAVIYWRKNGLPVYFTIDAGPNVHLICQGRDADKVIRKIEVFPGVQRIISNKPSVGSRLTSDHLF